VTLSKLSRNTARSFTLLAKYVRTHYEFLAPVIAKLQLGVKNKKDILLLDAGLRLGRMRRKEIKVNLHNTVVL
jgi:hypothetical protein